MNLHELIIRSGRLVVSVYMRVCIYISIHKGIGLKLYRRWIVLVCHTTA